MKFMAHGLGSIIVSAISAFALGQSADDYTAPRTEYGHPDFQGVWATNFIMPFERPDNVTSLVVTEEQGIALAAEVRAGFDGLTDPDIVLDDMSTPARVRGEYRSSIVVQPENGQIPYSESGLAFLQSYGDLFLTGYDHPEQRPLTERCLDGWVSAPMRSIPVMFPRQIIQTRDHVLIQLEDTFGLRIIPLRETMPSWVAPSIAGYSIGHWEGDSLVVTTTHFLEEDLMRDNFGRPLALGQDTVVVERFTRVSQAELNYVYTVTDPELYTEPWSGEYSMDWHAGPIYEYACHEGNYSLPGILLGGRIAADLEAQSPQ